MAKKIEKLSENEASAQKCEQWIKAHWRKYTQDKKSVDERKQILNKILQHKILTATQYYQKLVGIEQEAAQQKEQAQRKRVYRMMMEERLEADYLERHPEPQAPNPFENSRLYQAVKHSTYSLDGYAQALPGYLWANTIMSVGHGLGVLLRESLASHNRHVQDILVEEKIQLKKNYSVVFYRKAAQYQLNALMASLIHDKELHTDTDPNALKCYEEEAERALLTLRQHYPNNDEFAAAINATIIAQASSIVLDQLETYEEKVSFYSKIKVEDQEANVTANYSNPLGQAIFDTKNTNGFLHAYEMAKKQVKQPVSIPLIGPSPMLDGCIQSFKPLSEALKSTGTTFGENIYNYVMAPDASHQQAAEHDMKQKGKKRAAG